MAICKLPQRTYLKYIGYRALFPKILPILLLLCLVVMTSFVCAAEGDDNEIPEGSSNIWNAFSGEENNVKVMLESKSASGQSVLWTGTHYGLTLWVIDNNPGVVDLKTPENYSRSDGLANNKIDPNSLINDRINCMEKGEKVAGESYSWLWIGTDGGISHFNSNGTAARSDDTWKNYQAGVNVRGIKKLGSVVWFATDKGVFSYNGADWSAFTTAQYPGLPSDNVFSVDVDAASGDVWVGTDAGTAVFDGNSWSGVNVTETVYSIFVDGNDSWLGTASGVIKLSGKQNVERFLKTEKPWIYQILKGGGSELTFATSLGVFAMNSVSGEISQKAGGSVNYMVEDSLGNTWLAKGDLGIYEIGENEQVDVEKSSASLASENVNAIAWDGGDNTWFATNAGISRHTWQREGQSWKTFTASDSGLLSNSVNGISIDAQGVLWIATESGISRFDGKTSWTNLLEGKTIGAIFAASNGDVWATVDKEGIYKYDGTNWTQYIQVIPENPVGNAANVTVEEELSLPSNTFTAISEGLDKTIWFASQRGMISYNTKNNVWENKITSADNFSGRLQVNDIVSDSDGVVWAATTQGILRFDPATGSASVVNPVPDFIDVVLPEDNYVTHFTSISFSQEGYLVAGSKEGVYLYNGDKFNRAMNTDNSILPFNSVRTVEYGRAGRLWFGFGEVGGGVANLTAPQPYFVIFPAEVGPVTPTIGTVGVIVLSLLLPLGFFTTTKRQRAFL